MDYTESTITDVLNGTGTALLQHLCFSDHPSCQGEKGPPGTVIPRLSFVLNPKSSQNPCEKNKKQNDAKNGGCTSGFNSRDLARMLEKQSGSPCSPLFKGTAFNI